MSAHQGRLRSAAQRLGWRRLSSTSDLVRAWSMRSRRPRPVTRSRGQSLVEFAITLPVLLLIVTGAVDLGRVYFMTINMQNAVKEGAFYGARNPACDTNSAPGCTDPRTVQARVTMELDGITADTLVVRCYAPGTTDFTGGGKALTSCVDGDLYRVSMTATFQLATPIVSAIVGDSINLETSATSVVLTSFTSSGGPIDPGPGGTPQPTVAPGQCTVPDFRNGTRINGAQTVWEDVGGFTTTVTTVGPNGQDITWQSLPPGFVGACATTTITVSDQAQATPTPAPTAAPTVAPTNAPTAAPTTAPTPAPTIANCTVPQMAFSGGNALRITQAQGVWVGAGFTAANFSAIRPPDNDYNVRSQSIQGGQVRPCLTTTITVDN